MFACFLSQEEPKRVHQALKDSSWIKALQDELFHFKMQKVWVLVDLPKGKRAIGSKWVFRNKKDERGIVVRNKARLIAQGHTQEECIDYKEVFAPVAMIEAIRLFLAYASFMGFIVYQMDVKSDFLYETIEEEVYVCQPLGFEDPDYPDKVYKVVKALYGLHQAPRAWYETLANYLLENGFEDPDYPDKVYKVVKALYGLHQAPRAWYETLANYLLENGFQRGTIDQTLFIKKQKDDILLVQCWLNHHTSNGYQFTMSNPHQELTSPTQTALELLVQKQTALGKDSSNSLMADNLPKIVWQIINAVSFKLMLFGLTIDAAHLLLLEIFAELARIGYEKPSTKLTFYKAFYSAQWKFLVYTILQYMSAKRTGWNEFSSSMASAVICLTTEDEDDVNEVSAEPTIPSPTPATPPPPQQEHITPPSPTQEHIPLPPQAQTDQPSSPQQQPPSQTIEISMTLLNTLVKRLEKKRQFKSSGLKRLKKVGTTQRVESLADTVMDDQVDASKQRRKIAELDADEDVTLEEVDAEVTTDADV
nr:putative reverse transcriptase, RNA-dependent DNA polymerase [Tanacetum cinerariifolium]